jgi:hypothetical protein
VIPDRTVNLRGIQGINRTEDARLSDAGSWHTTMNMYGKLPGLLEERPGSRLVVNGKVPTTGASGSGKVRVNTLQIGLSDIIPAARVAGETAPALIVAAGRQRRGPALNYATSLGSVSSPAAATLTLGALTPRVEARPFQNVNLTSQLPLDAAIAFLPELREPVKRVGGMHRFYFGDGSRWTVAALNMGSGVDRLAYVDGANLDLMNETSSYPHNAPIMARGADWSFVPYRQKELPAPSGAVLIDGQYYVLVGSVASLNASFPGISQLPGIIISGVNYYLPVKKLVISGGYWGLACNGIDPPFTIKRSTLEQPGNQVYFDMLDVQKSDGYSSAGGARRLTTLRALAIYQGSVVYGGYRMEHLGADIGETDEVYDHYITFADPGDPHKLATTNGIISSVRIGDTEEEHITAMAVTTVPTDAQGLKGQLVVFTGQRVVIFDGLPPISGNPLGVNFASTVVKGIGCNAPKTIVSTSEGVTFLGSDGVVYLIRGLSGLVPIGRAVEPLLVSLTPNQQSACCAYYDVRDRFYKLSYPTASYSEAGRGSSKVGAPSQNPTQDRFSGVVADKQVWADIGHMVGQGMDLGIRWFGPHEGMKHACYASAQGKGDTGQVFAGSAIDASVYEVSVPGLYTDPVPENPTTTRALTCVAITGLFDLGDAHLDKTVSDLRLGVGTSVNVTLSSTISILGNTLGAQSVEEFSSPVTPPGDVLGSTFVLGTSKLVSNDDYRLVNLDPSKRLRGKMFRFMFHVSPAGSRVFFADFQFSYLTHARRH